MMKKKVKLYNTFKKFKCIRFNELKRRFFKFTLT